MDTVPAPAPTAPAVPAAPAALPWRKRHPVLARAALYGAGAAVVLALGLLLARRRRDEESNRQTGLLTTVSAIDQTRGLAPEASLDRLRLDVLAKHPDAEVLHEARLLEASLLDRLRRYAESEAVYADLDRGWPSNLPRGPLVVPWANMRVSAGRAADAKALLARPGATDGFPAADTAGVWARIEAVLRGAGAGTPPASAAPR